MADKKTPLRMCIVCREMKDKSQLIRVVRDNTNRYFIDTTYKANGRGAYICDNKECLLKCIKTRGLNKSFKSAVDADVYKMLENYVESKNS